MAKNSTGKESVWIEPNKGVSLMPYRCVFNYQVVKEHNNNVIVVDYAVGRAHAVVFSPSEHRATDVTDRKTVRGDWPYWQESCLKKLFGRVNYDRYGMVRCLSFQCAGYRESPVSVASGSESVIIENKTLNSSKRFIHVSLYALIFDMRGVTKVRETPDHAKLWYGFCNMGRPRKLHVWVNQELCMSTEVVLEKSHAVMDNQVIEYEDFRGVAI